MASSLYEYVFEMVQCLGAMGCLPESYLPSLHVLGLSKSSKAPTSDIRYGFFHFTLLLMPSWYSSPSKPLLSPETTFFGTRRYSAVDLGKPLHTVSASASRYSSDHGHSSESTYFLGQDRNRRGSISIEPVSTCTIKFAELDRSPCHIRCYNRPLGCLTVPFAHNRAVSPWEQQNRHLRRSG